MTSNENRIEPEDEGYTPLYIQWREAGHPARIMRGRQIFIALKDNDKLVFIKDGPPVGFEGYYSTSSFGGMNK